MNVFRSKHEEPQNGRSSGTSRRPDPDSFTPAHGRAQKQPNVNEFAPSTGLRGKLTDGLSATTRVTGSAIHSTGAALHGLHRGSSADKASPAVPSGRPNVDQFAPASSRGSRPTSAGARPSSADADEFAPTPGLRGKIAGGWSATTSGIRNHNPLHRTNDDRPSADIATAHPQQSKVQLDGESGGKPKGKLGFANPLNLKPHAAPGNREPQHPQPQMYDTEHGTQPQLFDDSLFRLDDGNDELAKLADGRAGYGAAPLPERSSSGKGVTGFLKDPIKGMGDPLKGFLGRKS